MLHPLGFIHGRFQVVHNDHLKYLLAGKSLCEQMIIGVTNPTPEQTVNEATDPARSNSDNNPLSFEERKTMIRDALLEAGVSSESFSIIPFPISSPKELKAIAPQDAMYYLTIYDDWGREKQRRLQSLGLTTHVMWDRPVSEKGISGKQVRKAIRTGSDYRSLVPPSVAEKVEQWSLQERFCGGSGSSGS